MMGRIVAVGFTAGLLLAAVLVVGQRPFAAARFEYGVYRSYEGMIERVPILHLRIGPDRLPLVAPGKNGFDSAVGAARLRGALIERGGIRMLEVEPGSLRRGGVATAVEEPLHRGRRTVEGEIVDSKCYLGVMNPGEGTVHRACARRCLQGGVPPGLVTAAGELIWLESAKNLAEYAGERVRVTGEWRELGDLRYLTGITVVRTAM